MIKNVKKCLKFSSGFSRLFHTSKIRQHIDTAKLEMLTNVKIWQKSQMLKNVKIYTITRFARYNPNNPDRPPRDSAGHKKSPEGLSYYMMS